MTIIEMLGQSGVLTLLGMGVVFGFLIIMIFSVMGIGKLIHALGMDKDLLAEIPAPQADHAAVTAAISAAVNEYQKTKGQ
jgi:oxaloacetate decarboxylase gamma subunit